VGVTLYYMFTTHPWLSQWLGSGPRPLWWGIQPISGGLFGVLAGTAVLVTVSLVTPRPGPEAQALLDRLRSPREAEGG
jgi:cation/acetate symporter